MHEVEQLELMYKFRNWYGRFFWIVFLSFCTFSVAQIQRKIFNPFIHNIEKLPSILVITLQDFWSMFGHFSTLWMKGLNYIFKFSGSIFLKFTFKQEFWKNNVEWQVNIVLQQTKEKEVLYSSLLFHDTKGARFIYAIVVLSA